MQKQKTKQELKQLLQLQTEELEQHRREREIGLALERVRAKAMAMRSSKDISDATAVVFNELTRLGIEMERCGIGIFNDTPIMEIWSTPLSQESKQVVRVIMGKINSNIHPMLQKSYRAWKDKKSFFAHELKGAQVKEYYELLEVLPGYNFPKVTTYSEKQILNTFNFNEGCIFVYSRDKLPEETKQIIHRFSKVFSHTYRRYLDIVNAETQAREAQIEASLERVRAKAMAMHSSKDISGATAVVFNELTRLGVQMERCGITLLNDTPVMEVWSTPLSPETKQVTDVITGNLDTNIHPLLQGIYKTWTKRKEIFTYEMEGEEIRKYYELLEKAPEYRFPKITKYKKRQVSYVFFFKEGGLFVFTENGLSDETKQIFLRFTKVFSLTYRRYLDIVKAETQAREAQIEASLERVRAKALAMHSSKDVSGATAIVFDELTRLGIDMERCGIVILDETPIMEVWSTLLSPENKKVIDVVNGKLNSDMHAMLQEIYKAWNNKKDFFAYTLIGDEVVKYYNKLEKEPGYQFPKIANYPERHVANCFYFNQGYVFAYTFNNLSDNEINVFQRFTNVFSLTYRRYQDLIKAEAQAREAIKQASLYRVRGEIASMRNTEDLKRITPVIWQELKELGVAFIRCGVFIIDEETDKTKAYLSTPEGKALAVLNLKYDENKLTRNTVDFWKKNQVYKEHWNKEDFINWLNSMMKAGQVQSAEEYQGSTTVPESLHLNFIPFKQGMLYVGNTSPISKEELDLVNSLANSFSVAYARYEDFNKLEMAKEQIEKTLDDLKAAQTQLIHSEKMASLGELTAGIAHEIQNPLNFVNNFSEVSSELVDEIREARSDRRNARAKKKETRTKVRSRESGSQEPRAKNQESIDSEELEDEILLDIKKNLEKINHHGKRADAIVKGMLEHSRTSTGEKVLADINSLADEYLRLSYHACLSGRQGLRAKDKSFKADYKTDFDPNLPKVNVVPQDIGRVLLNIINNAFQACGQDLSGFKNLTGLETKTPLVTVSTSPLEGGRGVKISISDNGPGIPDAIQDKIFQPFFTTKPTGQGTGLGLSLSYDIVKAHSGELKVKSKEGEGSEFIINLPA